MICKVWALTEIRDNGSYIHIFESHELALKFVLAAIEDNGWSVESEFRCDGIVYRWDLLAVWKFNKTTYYSKITFKITSHSVKGPDQRDEKWIDSFGINGWGI